ncbi:MAG: putative oxidoreductase [Devosia sp.]|nr:putative oxidoreductase [Devosia sp.]
MGRIFITGSTTGLGLIAGTQLLERGHQVIFHARNATRADELRDELPGNPQIVIGDLSSIDETLQVAAQVNDLGPMDAVIHNAGAGYGGLTRRTVEDLPDTFAVNVLAPYILTAKINRPARLVYLSSSMHRVRPNWDDILWQKRAWNGSQAYSESKFFVTALAFAIARLNPQVFSNAVDPGWVPTRMGGQGAPDDLKAGAATQVGLVGGDAGPLSELSGQYLHHMTVTKPSEGTMNQQAQDQLLVLCAELTGITLSF